jgi:hypothetical protein
LWISPHQTRAKASIPDQIAKANIEHFKKLLETETDPEKRRTIEKLLAEHEAKLAVVRKRLAERKKD